MSELRAASRVLLAWAICASLWDSSVEARSHRKAKAEDVQQAAKLLSDGKAALQAKNSGQAKSLFEDAYRKNPSAEALFQLGKLADSEGRIVAAQDVMRRFLQETAGDEEGPDQKEATRIVQLAGPPSGEVNILGARGAWVLVDEHLVGALPLPTPLLLESGNHRITVELGEQRIEEQVKALPGQTVEMRFNQKTGTVVVSVPPALVLLFDGDFTAEQQKTLLATVSKAVSKDRQVVVPGDKALKLKPQLADCLSSAQCLTELGNVNEALYVLRVRAKRTAKPTQSPTAQSPAAQSEKASWQFAIDVFDPSVGDMAARGVSSCEDCAPEQALGGASGQLGVALGQSVSRARGTVQISSSPTGADVFLAGEKVGTTPYKASRFVGELPVELRMLGQPPYAAKLKVEAGQVAQLDAVLTSAMDVPEPEPTLPPPPPKQIRYRTEVLPRPTWRLALGGSLVGIGLLGIGFGASALSVDGEPAVGAPCSDGTTTCKLLFDTAGIGGGLVTVGLLSLAGGIVTMALPGAKRQVQVTTLLGPSSLGLATGFSF